MVFHANSLTRAHQKQTQFDKNRRKTIVEDAWSRLAVTVSMLQSWSRWWFDICFIFIPTWGNDPIWLIFFKWVETTNQILIWISSIWRTDLCRYDTPVCLPSCHDPFLSQLHGQKLYPVIGSQLSHAKAFLEFAQYFIIQTHTYRLEKMCEGWVIRISCWWPGPYSTLGARGRGPDDSDMFHPREWPAEVTHIWGKLRTGMDLTFEVLCTCLTNFVNFVILWQLAGWGSESNIISWNGYLSKSVVHIPDHGRSTLWFETWPTRTSNALQLRTQATQITRVPMFQRR